MSQPLQVNWGLPGKPDEPHAYLLCAVLAGQEERMGYKATDPCLAKVAEDEPIFTLRAQDKLAPEIVRIWAMKAEAQGCSPAKVQEAYELAEAMEAWPTRKYPD